MKVKGGVLVIQGVPGADEIGRWAQAIGVFVLAGGRVDGG